MQSKSNTTQTKSTYKGYDVILYTTTPETGEPWFTFSIDHAGFKNRVASTRNYPNKLQAIDRIIDLIEEDILEGKTSKLFLEA